MTFNQLENISQQKALTRREARQGFLPINGPELTSSVMPRQHY
jgi:hypothetical protein